MNEIINQIEKILKELNNILKRIIGFYEFRSFKESLMLLNDINELITKSEL